MLGKTAANLKLAAIFPKSHKTPIVFALLMKHVIIFTSKRKSFVEKNPCVFSSLFLFPS